MGKVGLVVVSHSRRLAEGVAELAREIGMHRVRVQAAGGDVDGGLGTSFDLVDSAVRTVDDGAGVVLLADIGSAVLISRLFVEEADTTAVLADAPLVEGAVAAASMAAAGADLDAVVAAAQSAYEVRKS
ncbi:MULTISPECIES: dihydroxyacetone kinase phosphoryl donor subunit DhaM [Thermomonospora]|uniref:phosphoenolpyruvate--glycerone phosphotransferase n=1 Tax=Thermomonospora cellulosilytica TaxID=1411118 RepID=A0A7W3R677_9ACTN|nr:MULTISPECIES: dihydroxyacetone kinase phosphoryl donor subunit DhaM [Thermomonospora]MBA9001199.1 dihydroxyacetone kinase phosphotransfer subunit [Thermomonospora cellulosilytica]